MEDEHLDTIPATESDKVIKSSVENLVPILSGSEGIPDSVCDMPLCNNPTPLEAFKEHSETVIDFDDDSTSSDDDSPYGEDIDYVDASPPDAEIISSKVVEIVVREVGGIDDDILLTIKDDILREKLLNVNLLIANIEALKDNPTPSSDFVIKSPSTFPNSFLEETNTFDNSLTESETFCFNLEEISSGGTTTRSDYSLPDYEAFYDHIEERSSGSTTTHSEISLSKYDSMIFDLSINPFPPADRSDFYHEEFAGELAHIISPPEYDHFYFKIKPELGNLTMDVVEDNPTREPRVHVPNILPTHPTLHLDMNFILSNDSLFAYVVWIFLAFLTYHVTPPYLLSCGNEDTIFDPGISIYHSFMPDVSHRKRTSKKRTKNQAKLDKAEHGMEEHEKPKAQIMQLDGQGKGGPRFAFEASHTESTTNTTSSAYKKKKKTREPGETATAKTLDNGEIELTAIIDGKVKIVTEASVRRPLQLADSYGISSLPNTEIFEQLSLMGPKKTSWEQFSSNIATAIICLATNRKLNFSKLIFDGMGPVVQGEGSTHPVESHHIPTSAPSTLKPPISPTSRRTTRQESVVPQPRSPTQSPVANKVASTGVDVRYGGATTTITGLEAGQDNGNIDKTPTMPHDSPLLRKVESLDTDLQQTKLTYGVTYTKLIKKVKKLENKVKSSQARRRASIIVSDDEDDLEDPSKQGRKIAEIDQDPAISLEDIQARVEADEELAQRLQAEEREMYTKVEQARMLVELINQRKRYFIAQRAQERRNKPPTQAQQRTYMSNYIKHMGSHTLQQLKGYSFDEIKTLFETTMRRVNTFVLIESEVDRAVLELVAGSLKRDAEEELGQESSKRLKIGKSSEPAKESKDKEEELSQEELQQTMIIVLEQGMNVEALQTKYPIIVWEIYTEGTWKDDLVMLWSLVKENFKSTEPTDDKEREIWVELKRLFEPDTDDEL
ncbi:hypothetical protein Tco_0139602 [Tanacetum coccineum]